MADLAQVGAAAAGQPGEPLGGTRLGDESLKVAEPDALLLSTWIYHMGKKGAQ